MRGPQNKEKSARRGADLRLSSQNKEDATELQAEKAAIEAESAELVVKAAQAEAAMRKQAGMIGNLVHESVPVSETEVGFFRFGFSRPTLTLHPTGRQQGRADLPP